MSGIGPSVGASFIVALMGTAILVLALGNHLPRRARILIGLRVAFALGLPSFCVGLGVLMMMRVAYPLDAPRMAAAAAAGTGLFALAMQALRALAPSRIRRAMFQLKRGDGSPATVSLLLANLPRLRPSVAPTRPYRGAWVALMLEAAARLISHGRYADAARLCDEIPEPWLTETQSTHRDSALAIARMRLGELPAARAALERAHLERPHPERAAIEATRGMLLVLEGKPAEALAVVGDDRWIEEHTMVAILIARAHAHALLGDEPAARVALERVRASIGNAGLTAALSANPGPAARLAGP